MGGSLKLKMMRKGQTWKLEVSYDMDKFGGNKHSDGSLDEVMAIALYTSERKLPHGMFAFTKCGHSENKVTSSCSSFSDGVLTQSYWGDVSILYSRKNRKPRVPCFRPVAGSVTLISALLGTIKTIKKPSRVGRIAI
jgi:hypothetical protein